MEVPAKFRSVLTDFRSLLLALLFIATAALIASCASDGTTTTITTSTTTTTSVLLDALPSSLAATLAACADVRASLPRAGVLDTGVDWKLVERTIGPTTTRTKNTVQRLAKKLHGA